MSKSEYARELMKATAQHFGLSISELLERKAEVDIEGNIEAIKALVPEDRRLPA